MGKPFVFGLAALVVVSAALIFWFSASDCHASLDAFKASAARQGWQFAGRHGEAWPACEHRREEADDGIVFRRADGVEQRYEGFDGYRMQVRFLRAAAGAETVIVLRSQQRRANYRDEHESVELEPRGP
jgi:hypothetical protein